MASQAAPAAPESTSAESKLSKAEELRLRYLNLNERGDYATAILLADQACSLLEEARGSKSREFLSCSSNLAMLYTSQGEYDKATPLHERVLSTRKEILGSEHPDVAIAMNNMALMYIEQGKLEEAESLLERALSIQEKTLDSSHPKLANTLHNLAMIHMKRERYGEAEPLLARALSIHEGVSGPRHARTTITLGHMAVLYSAQGQYERAKPILEQVLSIQEEKLGPDHPQLIASLNNLADLYAELGAHRRAIPLLTRALSIGERSLGAEHPQIAVTLNNLAGMYSTLSKYEDAKSLLERAISISEKALGPEHPQVAASLNNLAKLHISRGDHDDARPLLERALSIGEKAMGPDHPGIAATLNEIAILHVQQGEYARALPIIERSLSITEKALGPEHPRVASSLGRVAILYMEQGEYEMARPFLERALLIDEKALGPEHPSVASDLNNMALMYRERGEPDEAEPLQRRALHIQERSRGPEHPAVANGLLNLGLLSMDRGRHGEAIPLITRALSIYEGSLGPEHPRVAAALEHLGASRLALGEREPALVLYRRALDLEERSLTRTFVIAEEPRRLAYAATLLSSTHRALSQHLQAAPDDLPSAELALKTLLRRKGRVQDLVAQSHAVVRRSLPDAYQHLLDDIAETRARYASLALRGPGTLSRAELSRELGELERDLDEKWSTLAEHTTMGDPSLPIDISDVQDALPDGAALVELTQYQPHFDALGVRQRKPGPPRYAAYLVFPDHIDWIDLGPASIVDAQVLDFRTRLLHEQSIPRDLYDTVMAPVVQRLGSTRELFIAPDGELNRVPFAALHDGDAYLVERYTLRFVTTGRDLLRPRFTSTAESDEALVVANPTGADLPGTEREAELVAGLFPNARTLVRDEATETRVLQQALPRLLHIGTHGFYDRSKPERSLETFATERMRSSMLRDEPLSPGLVDNPMLASGLVLATPDPEHASEADDGRLTAYEVSGWDLQGTELVVLSACGTGLGTVKTGEGVMGLRRAFAMAGAQTQVMSLWDLGDETTPEVMELYYRKLAAGVGRGDAMQQAQLELLHGEHPHPLHWAAFVVVGEWTPLSWVEPAVETPPPVERPRGCQASVGATGDASGIVVLGLLGFVARRRRRRLRNILGPTLLASACASSPRGSDLDSPASLTWADARMVSGWVRGEARRPIPVDARGASLGLQKVMLDDPASRAVEPGSCGMGLRSLLSIPGQPGAVLVSNASGELFRYEGGARRRMTTRVALPPIGELLGLEAEASPLHLLVSDREGEQLWELELGDAEVLSATFLGEGVPFADRVAFLDRYWVGRCLYGARGCLALVHDDVQLSLDRRADLEAEPEIVMPLGQALVTDVGYADASGTSVYLLTAQVCEDEAATSRRGSGVVEPQAPQ